MDRKSSKSGSKLVTSLTIVLLTLIVVFSALVFVYVRKNSDEKVLAVTVSNIVLPSKKIEHYGISDREIKEGYELKVVGIKRGQHIQRILTNKTDIFEVLRENHINLDKKEKVVCNTDIVRFGTVISVVRTETYTEYISTEIPFITKTVETSKYGIGEKYVAQKGCKGLLVQKVETYFEDGKVISTKVLEERVKKDAIMEIVEVGTAFYSLTGIEQRGYNCPYWYSVVDSGPYTDEEKAWLKFVMKCESGCNAESNKTKYKGLFQWDPYFWRKQYSENIFDGHAQLKHTIEKYRAGAATMWPACNRKFNRN